MKSFQFVFCLSLFFFLSACAPQPSLSLSEMENTYEASLSSLFSPLPFFKEERATSLQTQTDLSLALLSSSNTLQGSLAFASTNYIQQEQEKSHLQFTFGLQNSTTASPLFLSGNIDTLYLDHIFYFNIQDFILSMKETTPEVNFINLLAQQLTHTWVSLDNSEHFGISVVETPDFFTLWMQLLPLFSAQALKTDVPSSSPTQEITGTLTAVDETYVNHIQTFYTLVAQLANIPVQLEALRFDSSATGNQMKYVVNKNHQVTHSRTLNFHSSTHTFTTTLTCSPEQCTITLFNLRPLDETQPVSDISLLLSFQPRGHQLYTFTATKLQKNEVVGNFSTDFSFSPNEKGIQISFNGGLQLSSLLPLSSEPLSLTFKATMDIQPSPAVNFELTGHIIQLSELF
jgi:hypothetical protein